MSTEYADQGTRNRIWEQLSRKEFHSVWKVCRLARGKVFPEYGWSTEYKMGITHAKDLQENRSYLANPGIHAFLNLEDAMVYLRPKHCYEARYHLIQFCIHRDWVNEVRRLDPILHKADRPIPVLILSKIELRSDY